VKRNGGHRVTCTWKKNPVWYGLSMVDFMWCKLWWYAVLIQLWCASGYGSSKPQCRYTP
jgi:hypothetical protein